MFPFGEVSQEGTPSINEQAFINLEFLLVHLLQLAIQEEVQDFVIAAVLGESDVPGSPVPVTFRGYPFCLVLSPLLKGHQEGPLGGVPKEVHTPKIAAQTPHPTTCGGVRVFWKVRLS